MALNLPVRVQGHEPNGEPWAEMTTSEDASFGGASFSLKHPVVTGQVLNLSLPLPKRFRQYDLTDPSYHVYGLVRGVRSAPEGVRVGLMFLGKNPPRGYDQNRGGRYLLPTDAAPIPKERREFLRGDIYVNLRLKRTVGDGASSQEEQTIAENVGKGGARVLTSMPVSKGEIVLVEEVGGPFRTRAEIRNIYIGPDLIPRFM